MTDLHSRRSCPTAATPPPPAVASGGSCGGGADFRRTVPPIIPGEVFGRWTVLSAAYTDGNRQQMVRVRCVCGYETLTRWTRIRAGKSRGCVSVSCRNGNPRPVVEPRKPRPARPPRAPRIAPLPVVEVQPGPAVALIYPLDMSKPLRPVAMRVVLTGRTRTRHIAMPGADGTVMHEAEALVEGEREPRMIAVETMDSGIIAEWLAEQNRPPRIEVWA